MWLFSCMSEKSLRICHLKPVSGASPDTGEIYPVPVQIRFFCHPAPVMFFTKPAVKRKIRVIDLQHNSELERISPTFPELSMMFKRIMCLFGSTCVKSSSSQWTLISQGLGPNIEMSRFKPYWGSQLLLLSCQKWLSCVKGRAAK